jgi:toxin YoeB
VSWRLVFTKQAKKDARKTVRSGLKPQAERLPEILTNDPFQTPPPPMKNLWEILPGHAPEEQTFNTGWFTNY